VAGRVGEQQFVAQFAADLFGGDRGALVGELGGLVADVPGQ